MSYIDRHIKHSEQHSGMWPEQITVSIEGAPGNAQYEVIAGFGSEAMGQPVYFDAYARGSIEAEALVSALRRAADIIDKDVNP